jgi:hypothetical protein
VGSSQNVLKDALNVITYEGTYFLKNMCAVSFISKIYVSRTAVPKKLFANLMGIGWEK